MVIRILTVLVLACIALYTGSYGTWTWKQKNKLGAVMVYVIAIVTVALPVYTIFFRE